MCILCVISVFCHSCFSSDLYPQLFHGKMPPTLWDKISAPTPDKVQPLSKEEFTMMSMADTCKKVIGANNLKKFINHFVAVKIARQGTGYKDRLDKAFKKKDAWAASAIAKYKRSKEYKYDMQQELSKQRKAAASRAKVASFKKAQTALFKKAQQLPICDKHKEIASAGLSEFHLK